MGRYSKPNPHYQRTRCHACHGRGVRYANAYTPPSGWVLDGGRGRIGGTRRPDVTTLRTCERCHGTAERSSVRPLFDRIDDLEVLVREFADEATEEHGTRPGQAGATLDPVVLADDVAAWVEKRWPDEVGTILSIMLEPLAQESIDDIDAAYENARIERAIEAREDREPPPGWEP